jgi:hypothetical protein
MFVRFRLRPPGHRLQISIVETRRADGEVCQEHVAGLGSIVVPPSVADRVAFWQRVHERLAKLSNRIDQETCGKLMGSLHEKIPMPTAEEQRASQRENLEAEEKFWAGLHDMHSDAVDGTEVLAARAESDIAARRAELAKAADRRDAARAARECLERGEDVAGGLGRRMTQQDLTGIMRAAGWKAADFRNAGRLVEIHELGGWDELMAEVMRRRRGSELAASRAVLRRRRSTE